MNEGLRDLRCYGPALAVALWREAVRVGGNSALVSGLLEAAAPALPTLMTASIDKDNGSTARLLIRTILALFGSSLVVRGCIYVSLLYMVSAGRVWVRVEG